MSSQHGKTLRCSGSRAYGEGMGGEECEGGVRGGGKEGIGQSLCMNGWSCSSSVHCSTSAIRPCMHPSIEGLLQHRWYSMPVITSIITQRREVTPT